VFGDGGVTVISTPGHQSLLVRLPRTGWLVLSGDAVHFRDNWDNKRVASMNTSADQTQASFMKIEQLMADKKAALWMSYDKPQSQAQKRSLQFYD
jgi:glyoxylase-like metal-dependent hydrolase (beta-lactamase superfamily II)